MRDKSKQAERIKFPILSLVCLSIILIIGAAIYINYRYQMHDIDHSFVSKMEETQNLFDMEVGEETELITDFLDSIEENKTLRSVWLAQDKDSLLTLALPIYRNISAEHQISDFYFIGPEKICFLRVHNPANSGDSIQWYTLEHAAEKMEPTSGIELGASGIFALRVVHPWIIDNQLTGYIELGMEIDHITQEISKISDLATYFAVEKKYLLQNDWENGYEIV